MKKRLMTALAASALTAAMVPAAASADQPMLYVRISCELEDAEVTQTWANNPAGLPAGEAVRFVRDFMAEDLEDVLHDECVPGTVRITIERVV